MVVSCRSFLGASILLPKAKYYECIDLLGKRLRGELGARGKFRDGEFPGASAGYIYLSEIALGSRMACSFDFAKIYHHGNRTLRALYYYNVEVESNSHL